MAKQEPLKIEGQVVEVLPNAMFKVKIETSDRLILAYVGGKLKQHSISILLGDTVVLEMSPYDLTKARIVFRK